MQEVLKFVHSLQLFEHGFSSRVEAVCFIEDFLTDCIKGKKGGDPGAAKVNKRQKVKKAS